MRANEVTWSTHTRTVAPGQVDNIVHQLLKRSCWFEVDPLPFGEFMVGVKAEQQTFLDGLVDG